MKISKKLVLFGFIFLFIGLVIGFILFNERSFVDYVVTETEKSYKTNKPEPRYLKSFKRNEINYPEDRSSEINDIESKRVEILNYLNEAGELARNFPWFDKIIEEHILLTITDLGNAYFTLIINDGEFEVINGYNKSKRPTAIVPISSIAVANLINIFSNNELSYQDEYQLFYAIAAPGLQALYENEPLYTSDNMTQFKFDDFIQIVIPPEEPVFYLGSPLSIELTAVNIDGQWIVVEGLYGDPDFRLSLNLKQAADLYVMGVYELREANNLIQATNISNRFLDLINETTVYIRADHR